jgi:ketosteroid isomerase-like protein
LLGEPKAGQHLLQNHKGVPMIKRVCRLLGLLALAGAMGVQAQQAGGDTQKTIMDLENQWLQAEKANNPDMIAASISDKYVATTSEGKLEDKAKTLEEIKTRKYNTAEYEDVQITAFGNTAIARGGYKGSGTEPSGKPFAEHLRWTDTWVKTSGKWQVVATQYTAVKG